MRLFNAAGVTAKGSLSLQCHCRPVHFSDFPAFCLQ